MQDIDFGEKSFGESGTSLYLPPYKIGNEELASFLAANGVTKPPSPRDPTPHPYLPDDIGSVTGVFSRYALQPLGEEPSPIQETVPQMATLAAIRALKRNRWEPQAIDTLVVCSSYPYGSEISGEVASGIGARNCQTLDVYAACAGGTVAIKEAIKRSPKNSKVLVIGAEHFTANLPADSNRALFSDGAAVFAFENQNFEIVYEQHLLEPNEAIKMTIDESLFPEGSVRIHIPNDTDSFKMNGRAVLFWVIHGTPFEQTLKAYEELKIQSDRIFILNHQGSGRANGGFLQKLAKNGVDAHVSQGEVAAIGNLASASILAENNALLSTTQVRKGDILLYAGFGAGFLTSILGLQAIRDLQ